MLANLIHPQDQKQSDFAPGIAGVCKTGDVSYPYSQASFHFFLNHIDHIVNVYSKWCFQILPLPVRFFLSLKLLVLKDCVIGRFRTMWAITNLQYCGSAFSFL